MEPFELAFQAPEAVEKGIGSLPGVFSRLRNSTGSVGAAAGGTARVAGRMARRGYAGMSPGAKTGLMAAGAGVGGAGIGSMINKGEGVPVPGDPFELSKAAKEKSDKKLADLRERAGGGAAAGALLGTGVGASLGSAHGLAQNMTVNSDASLGRKALHSAGMTAAGAGRLATKWGALGAGIGAGAAGLHAVRRVAHPKKDTKPVSKAGPQKQALRELSGLSRRTAALKELSSLSGGPAAPRKLAALPANPARATGTPAFRRSEDNLFRLQQRNRQDLRFDRIARGQGS